MTSVKLACTKLLSSFCPREAHFKLFATLTQKPPLRGCTRCYQVSHLPTNNLERQKKIALLYSSNRVCSSASFSKEAQNGAEHVAKIEFIPKKENDAADMEGADQLDIIEEAFPKIDALSTDVDVDYLNTLGPQPTASFNLAAFVNHSETLLKMVDFGIDLSWIEGKYPQLRRYVASLDFEKDVQPLVSFLREHHLSEEEIATVITKNPFLLTESLENLNKRISYLRSKRFTEKNVARIITACPNFLSFPSRDIDARLGFFQKTFFLTGNEVRYLTLRRPKTIITDIRTIQENRYTLMHDLGVDESKLKDILLTKSKVFCITRAELFNRFEQFTLDMGIPKDLVVQTPNALLTREEMVRPRHLYLVHLGAAQYDPALPCYVSLQMLTEATDEEFSKKAAGTPVEQYNKFLKTL